MAPFSPPWCESARDASDRQTHSLAALAVTLFLVVAGLYLVDVLRLQAQFQDCVMSGKAGCEALAS